MKNKERGITLVALVVTIVIMLILVGVTIGIAMGENGLIGKAKQSVAKYKEAQETENNEISDLEKYFEELEGKDNKDIVITHSPTEWTNGTVKVKIESRKKECKVQYMDNLDDGWKDYTQEIEVGENKKIYARLLNGEEEVGIEEHDINNIDKTNPTVGKLIMKVGGKDGVIYKGNATIQDDIYIELEKGKDGESGHKKTTYNIISGPITKQDETDENLLNEKGKYEIEVVTEDLAGNISKSAEKYIINMQEFGSYVDYNVDINSTPYDWKVFYKGTPEDGEANGRIFIIAADLVPNSNSALITATDSSHANMEISSFNDYAYYGRYWTNADTLQNTPQNNLFMATKYSLNANYLNSRMSSTLLNTNNWEPFLDNGKRFGEFAIGGPTLEMFVASWNKYYNGKHDVTLSTDQFGYNVSLEQLPFDIQEEWEKIYFPYLAGMGEPANGAYEGYWIVAPYAIDERYMPVANRYCQIAHYATFNGNFQFIGIRPVVALRQGVKLVWDTDNGVYKLEI